MSVQQLLTRLRDLDVKLWVEGDKLRYSAPQGVLTDDLLGELASNKKAMIDWLKQAVAVNDLNISDIEPASRERDLPASYQQERLLFIEQLVPDTNSYNVPLAVKLRGALNIEALEKSLNAIVSRHESLRTRFATRSGEQIQIIEPEQLIKVVVVPVTDRDEIMRQIEKENSLPFDLATGPLLRCKLFRITEDENILALTLHHIVCDGWSLGLLFNELSSLYACFCEGESISLPELPIQYADYAVWQRDTLTGNVLEELLGYWRERLNEPATLQLPTDHPRPPVQSFQGGFMVKELPPVLGSRLRALSEKEKSTLFMTLLTAFTVLLHRYCGQDDIVVGTPIANRNRSETEDLIGFFINMLVLRTDLSGNPSFREMLSRVKRIALDAYKYQDLPFEKLVSEFRSERDLSRNPLFQVSFAMQNAPLSPVQLKGLVVEPVQTRKAATRFDLEVNLWESDQGLIVSCNYNSDLFEAQTIDRMLTHYQQLLGSVVESPDQSIEALPILLEEERNLLLREWNHAVSDCPRDQAEQSVNDQLVHQQVASQAALLPEHAAVVGNGSTVNYQELNETSNRLAHYLIERGVVAGTLIAVLLERSPELIIAQLAVLKAGAAYVSIDPEYPAQRLAYVLNDTAAPVLLTQSSLQSRITDYPGEQFNMDRQTELLQAQSTELPDAKVNIHDLAYIIYTSGSTGEPKGVEVSHMGLLNLVSWHQREYEVSKSDRATHLAGLGFDASVWELWPYITSGATLYLVPDEQRLEANGLWAWMAERDITLSFLPTPLAETALQIALPDNLSLRVLLTGGDRLHSGLVDTGLPFRLVNHYGPTENAVVATFAEVDVLSVQAPLIGRPIDNVQTYILDACMQPVPIGVVGELYIGGRSLARGYLNQPQLTEEKFVPNPFTDEAGERLYRTGDLVCYREAGQIEYIGRIDQQVKIRGFRIELGEIESVLCRQAGVQVGTVLVREDEQNTKRIIAYVVFETDNKTSIEGLRSALQEVLPGYMLPSAFKILEELPLTANGKLDRDALLSMDIEYIASENYVAPQSDVEIQIAKIWCDLLGIEKSGSRDNFFDLGGHSLLMSQVQARLNEEFGRNIPMLDLFQYPTIETLARHLVSAGEQSKGFANARARMEKHRSTNDDNETIAIIGMAGRFPGAATVEQFWDNLANGVESVRFFTDEELIAAGIPEQLIAEPRFVPAKGYLDDAEMFDAAFFGYPPSEAELLDPQHRLFLECAWEALERAGYDPERYPGLIGVYAGSSSNSYRQNLNSHPELVSNFGMQLAISSGKDFLPTRVSYKLNLRGPSVTIQTACSTSLVAIHEACKSLLENECDIALAGGVSVLSPRVQGYMYQDEGILSPDGHCRAFAADAKGTVGGEGVGILVLKRLSEAKQDGDIIHAVINGTAINNDGSNKVGYTAPSVEGQAEVIALAQAAAGVTPESISYIETHGTGTSLGDPIEIAALVRVFGETNKDSGMHCALGAIKTNIGHLDAAAGVAGVIKTALALKHSQIPPSLNFKKPNAEIDFASGPFFVNTELKSWEKEGSNPRCAGVSSFGIGGTNAHAILEQAPPREKSGPGREWQMLPVSAKSEAALDLYTNRIADYLGQNQDANLADLSFTLRTGRGQFDFRRAVICKDGESAIAGLKDEQAGQVWTNNDVTNSPPVIFMFPGQGSQYVQMGQGLYETETVFREIVDDCCDQLKVYIEVDLRDTLFTQPADDSEQVDKTLRQTLVAQCSLFVIEYALARLWMSWGIQPAAMIGHSIGEYVAACVTGAIDLDEALLLIACRGQAMAQAPPGAMLSVPLPEQQISPYLKDNLWLSVINGHSSCVVSGTTDAIDELYQRLLTDGVEALRLNTSGAFHSGLMDDVVPQLVEAASKLNISSPQIPYISNVTGTWIDESQLRNPEYWGQHLRNTVRFAQGVDVLLEKYQAGVFLEVGPGKTLGSMLRQSASDNGSNVEIISSLGHPREKLTDGETITRALAELWLCGADIDWQSYDQDSRRCRVELPTYPFQRQKYWVELATDHTAASMTTVRQPMKDWFYIPSWKRSMPFKGNAADGVGGQWLVLCDNAGISEKIKQWLRSANYEAVYVLAGSGFAQQGSGDYTIEPGNADDYRLLVESLLQDSKLPQHVIHLWAVTAESDAVEFPDFIDDPLVACYHSLIYLTQALGESGSTDAVDIRVISNSAHTVLKGDRLCPVKATLQGPCAVISQEYANISCRNIEIEISNQDSDIDALMSETLNPTTGMVVAYRNGQRWIKSYEPVVLDAVNQKDLPIKRDGVYLITGGLGGIGLTLASFLAQEFQARLVLTGRSELPPRESWAGLLATENGNENPTTERIKAIHALEAHGAEVLVLQADVVDKDRMQEVVNLALKEFGEINGVIHSAGVPGGRIMQLQSAEIAEAVMAPKVAGTRIVAELCRAMPLDFMVFCSSLAAVIGVAGQVDYYSANAFEDAYADYYSTATGIPVISINWDTWNESGMAVNAIREQGGDKSDLRALGFNNNEGMEAFKRILARATVPQVVISTYDLSQRMPKRVTDIHSDPDAELETINPEASLTATTRKYERPPLKTSYVAPSTDVEKIICELWQELLGIDGIGIDDNFFELGGHSLLAINALNRLNKSLGSTLSLAKYMSLATVGKISNEIQTAKPIPDIDTKPLLAKVDLSADGETFPLSFAQERLWYVHSLYPNVRAVYNIQISMQLDTTVNKLEAVLGQIQQRNAILRTTYIQEGEQPVQKVNQDIDVSLQVMDTSDFTESEIKQEILKHSRTPFNLETGPIWRCAVVKQDDRVLTLVITIHHIATDGWSMNLLRQEILRLCRQGTIETDLARVEPSVQYIDYALWYRDQLDASRLDVLQTYWSQKLSGMPSALNLPIDKTRPPVYSYSGALEFVALSAAQSNDLRQFARENEVTLYMVMLAVFKLLLSRYAQQSDIIVGTPVSGRTLPEMDDIVGLFVNTLVLRTDLSGSQTFTTLLKNIRETTLDAFEHQDFPFEKTVEMLQPERDLSRSNPLFQVMFTFFVPQDVTEEGAEQKSETLSEDIESVDIAGSQDDLSLFAKDDGGQLIIGFDYNDDLFDAATIRQMITHYRRLLEASIAAPETRIDQLEILSDEEKHLILHQWNQTQADFVENETLHSLFDQQVERTPQAIAVSFEQHSLDYAGLEQKANDVACLLIAKNVRPGQLVGVYIERSIDLIVAILGILKAGAAYVPLDPEYPPERIGYMVADSKIQVLLAQEIFKNQLPSGVSEVIFLDNAQLYENVKPQELPAVTEDMLAYVIYTSGSTGKPKGVMVPHSAVVNHACWMRDLFKFDQTDRFLQKSPVSFDASVCEIFVPLLNGARVVMAVPGGHQDSEYLIRAVQDNNITTLILAPSELRMLLQSLTDSSALSTLKRMGCGGDALTPDLQQAYYENCTAPLYNMYGPTESTIDATSFLCTSDFNQDNIPIGRPVSNSRVYILDPQLQPVPIGVHGELHIAGAQLAKGYLNQNLLTREKFITDPFSSKHHERMYKSGDRARYRHDGTIEYCGRIDNQVKLRGYRIELGELESILLDHDRIAQAAVIVREDEPGDQRLVAYLVPETGAAAEAAISLNKVIYDYLKQKLPAFMVPSNIEWLELFPLFPNGKVNYSGFPRPSHSQKRTKISNKKPESEMEILMASIWEDLLDIDDIETDDMFFDLGGHSLLTLKVAERFAQESNIRISPASLINQTLRQLAASAEASLKASDKDSDNSILGSVKNLL